MTLRSRATGGPRLQGAQPSTLLSTLPQMGRGLGDSEGPCIRGLRQVIRLTLTVGPCVPTIVTRMTATFLLKHSQTTSGHESKVRGLEPNCSIQCPFLQAGFWAQPPDQATVLLQHLPWLPSPPLQPTPRTLPIWLSPPGVPACQHTGDTVPPSCFHARHAHHATSSLRQRPSLARLSTPGPGAGSVSGQLVG